MSECNCHEWAELGTYLCPVHGHYNQYRRGGEMKPKKKPEIFPNNTGIRKLYNDLKLKVTKLEEEVDWLRNQVLPGIEKQNKLLSKLLGEK